MEVTALVNARGIQPVHVGPLPEALAAHAVPPRVLPSVLCCEETSDTDSTEAPKAGHARARYRVKVSTTIDPELIRAVDLFVDQTPDYSRSRVFDEALRLWYAREQEKAMEAQFAGPRSSEEEEERADWRRARNAASARIFGRDG